MKLPEAVQSAAEAKVLAELKPITEKLTRLKATVDAYEALVKQDVERRISNSLLAALGISGEMADPDQALGDVAVDLRRALSEVADLLGGSGLVNRLEPVDPPSPSAPSLVVPPPTPAPPKPPRKANPEDVTRAQRLLAEIEALRPEVKEEKHHRTRLFPLLQAITAECRLLQDRIPMGHDMSERLGKALGVLNGLRIEGGVEEYIKGLAFGSNGDWQSLSFKNRRRVEEYDRDTEKKPAALPGKELKLKTPKPKEADPANIHEWPALPQLRALTKPVLLAGGLVIPQKLKSIKERFGLNVEWHEIDHDNPRASQTLMLRIRAGRVGAVILLEGIMRHSTYKPVVESCHINGVPYAMGDKAGVASLQAAFDELERKFCQDNKS